MSGPERTSRSPSRNDVTRPPTWGSTSKYISSKARECFTSHLTIDDDPRTGRRIRDQVAVACDPIDRQPWRVLTPTPIRDPNDVLRAATSTRHGEATNLFADHRMNAQPFKVRSDSQKVLG